MDVCIFLSMHRQISLSKVEVRIETEIGSESESDEMQIHIIWMRWDGMRGRMAIGWNEKE